MRSNRRINNTKQGFAVALCVIATLFISTRAYAWDADAWKEQYHLEGDWYKPEQDSLVLKWHADAMLMSNYIWRGMHCGGLSLQTDFNIGFEGFRAGMWWNLGAKNWQMQAFNPELDVYLSYSKYGITFTLMEMYYFDRYADGTPSLFFDYSNHEPGGGGVTTELRLKYRVSDRLPLSLLWCTRFSGRDGYYVTMPAASSESDKQLKRAYSTYIELGYDFSLPWDLTLATRLGITPWKSLYTGFEGNFAVVNTEAKLTRSWQVANHLQVNGLIDVVVNPYSAKTSKVLWNIGFGIQFL